MYNVINIAKAHFHDIYQGFFSTSLSSQTNVKGLRKFYKSMYVLEAISLFYFRPNFWIENLILFNKSKNIK